MKYHRSVSRELEITANIRIIHFQGAVNSAHYAFVVDFPKVEYASSLDVCCFNCLDPIVERLAGAFFGKLSTKPSLVASVCCVRFISDGAEAPMAQSKLCCFVFSFLEGAIC